MRTPFVLFLLVGIASCSSSKPKSDPTPAHASQTQVQASSSHKQADQSVETQSEKPTAPAAADATEAKVDVLDPSTATMRAPETYVAKLETTKGDILIDVTRAWSPHGADRFYNLVKAGYFEDIAFFRVIDGFMAQAGIHGDPSISRAWKSASIDDDKVASSNTRGMVTFATAGPNTRTTQFFINLADNARLDSMGFSPFGKVRDMKAVDALYAGYGEGAPRGQGPSQGRIEAEGNAYLKSEFPKLDYIRRATIVE